MCMAKLGSETRVGSYRAVMGQGLVKKMVNFCFNAGLLKPGWGGGGNLAPPWNFSNQSGPFEIPECLHFEYAWLS